MALSASYRGQDEKEAVFSFSGWVESLGSFPGGKEMFVYYSICLYTTVYVCIQTFPGGKEMFVYCSIQTYTVVYKHL